MVNAVETNFSFSFFFYSLTHLREPGYKNQEKKAFCGGWQKFKCLQFSPKKFYEYNFHWKHDSCNTGVRVLLFEEKWSFKVWTHDGCDRYPGVKTPNSSWWEKKKETANLTASALPIFCRYYSNRYSFVFLVSKVLTFWKLVGNRVCEVRKLKRVRNKTQRSLENYVRWKPTMPRVQPVFQGN